MERRAIIAIILTFVVIMLWGVIQSKFFPPPPAKPPEEVQKEKVLPLEKKTIETVKPIPQKAIIEKVFPEKEVSVETPNYTAVFTTRDARLKHFKLKKYEDRIEESPIAITLTGLVRDILGKKAEEPEKPKPLDLVNTKE